MFRYDMADDAITRSKWTIDPQPLLCSPYTPDQGRVINASIEEAMILCDEGHNSCFCFED